MTKEGFIWGSILVFSAGAGVYGFADWLARGGATPLPEPMILHEDEPEESLGVEPPRLPEVPDLGENPRAAAHGRPGDPADSDGARLATEMRLLHEARTAVRRDPPQALRLAEEHRMRFPDGALREQREAIAIMALIVAGRSAEAERRYWEFHDDFPTSDFHDQLEAMMRAQIPESDSR